MDWRLALVLSVLALVVLAGVALVVREVPQTLSFWHVVSDASEWERVLAARKFQHEKSGKPASTQAWTAHRDASRRA